MKKFQAKLILWLLAVFMLAGLNPANATDKRIQYNELLCGANSPTCTDTLNRLSLIEHNNDGTHKGLTQVKDPYVDVRAYGADPTGVSDSTTAFTNAIAYALSVNRPLYIPTGTYLISGKLSITLPSNSTVGFTMRGDGRGETILKYTGAASIGSLIEVSKTGSYGLNVKMTDFGIDLTGAPSGTVGLKINAGIWRSVFDNIYVTRNIPAGVRTGVGIYMGSATPGDAGSYDNKFDHLYVAHFSKNLHFQGTDASGNTITNTSINNSYISDGDYNLYAEWFNGMGAFVTQYESAQTSGAYFANGESYYHMGGSIESAVGGAKGVSMDANTKTVVALCDYFNNAGGNFVSNGQIGHFYKTSNSGLIVQPGAEIRFDTDASYTSKARFLKNGVSDVRISADGTSNALNFTDASSNKVVQIDVGNKILNLPTSGSVFRLTGTSASPTYFQLFENGVRDVRITPVTGNAAALTDVSGNQLMKWDVTNKVVELPQSASWLRLTGTAASPTYIQFWENGVRDVQLIPDSGYSISVKNGATGNKALNIDTTNMVFSYHDGTSAHKVKWAAAAPVAGTWAQGDIVYNNAPAAGGTIGWVCTTGGTPGTWKTFGAIAP